MTKVYQAEDFISISDAITLLADRDRRRYDTDRLRKARMRRHIMYAVDNCELTEIIRHGKKCYVYGRVVALAQVKWPGKYDDLVSIRDPIVGGAHASLPGLVGGGTGCQIPGTLPDCQAQLVRVAERNFELQEQLTAARNEVDKLRPDAEAWQHQVEVNTANAKQLRPRG